MSLSAIQDYSDEDDNNVRDVDNAEEMFDPNFRPSSSSVVVNLAPEIVGKHDTQGMHLVDLKKTKEITFNAKYEDLFATPVGPSNPFKSDNQKAQKNVLTGFVEAAHVNDFNFETERRTFDSFGYARDPSSDNIAGSLVGDKNAAVDTQEVTVFEKTKIRPGDQRKRTRNLDSSDVTGYTGPWGKFVDEESVAKPDPDSCDWDTQPLFVEESPELPDDISDTDEDDECENWDIFEIKNKGVDKTWTRATVCIKFAFDDEKAENLEKLYNFLSTKVCSNTTSRETTEFEKTIVTCVSCSKHYNIEDMAEFFSEFM